MSSCLIEKYNGFTIISIEYKKRNKKKNFKVIDIIYKPTKNVETEPLCYFTKDIAKAYSSFHSKGKKGLTRAHKVRQCFYCNKFFISEIKQIRHVKTVQENQVLSIIFTISVLLVIKTILELRATCHLQYILILKQPLQLITV